jgi:hypothetical protein
MNLTTKQKDLTRVVLVAIAITSLFCLVFLFGYIAWYLASLIFGILPPWVGGGVAIFWMICECSGRP